VQAARKLTRRTFRERERRFLLEGPLALGDALAAGATVHDVFVSEEPSEVVRTAASAGARVHEVSEQVLKAISDAATPQGVVAVVELHPARLEDLSQEAGLVLVLSQIRDPGNAGTLIRSAAASGCGGIVFSTGSVDPFAPKTLRAAAGSVFRAPLVTKVDLAHAVAHLRTAGFALVGADARSDRSLYDLELERPTAIVLGNESWGLADVDARELDVVAGIPMPGPVESLNVGVAGSLFLFEAARQRLASSP
jgi:TrmH family RNA methyltransferase